MPVSKSILLKCELQMLLDYQILYIIFLIGDNIFASDYSLQLNDFFVVDFQEVFMSKQNYGKVTDFSDSASTSMTSGSKTSASSNSTNSTTSTKETGSSKGSDSSNTSASYTTNSNSGSGSASSMDSTSKSCQIILVPHLPNEPLCASHEITYLVSHRLQQ